MRLRALTGLAVEDLQNEIDAIHARIKELELILSDESVLKELIKSELNEIADKYGNERRTQIEYTAGEFDAADFYADDDMIITISHMGYIKRTPLAEFRAQNRGTMGSRGTNHPRPGLCGTYIWLRCTTICSSLPDKGLVYKMRVYELPKAGKTARAEHCRTCYQSSGRPCAHIHPLPAAR